MVRKIFLIVALIAAIAFTWTAFAGTQWIVDGVRVSTDEGSQSNNRIIPDGSGGALVFWSGTTIDSVSGAFVQKIDADGYRLWSDYGKLLCTDNCCWASVVTSDGNGGAFYAWSDCRASVHSWNIYAQRIDADGNPLWISGGVPVCLTPVVQKLIPYFIIADETGGAIIVWHDDRNGPTDIYTQRIDGNGVRLWNTDGVPVCTAPNHQYISDIVADGYGGAVFVWIDLRAGEHDEYDIYMQHIDQNGNAVWAPNGQAICTAPGQQINPGLVRHILGIIIVIWVDIRGASADIYGQKLDILGNQLWTANGKPICTEAHDEHYPKAVTDGNGGAIIAWEDYRDGLSDIYAQRINEDGVAQWTAGGVPVIQEQSSQKEIVIVSDGNGGAIIACNDYRSLVDYDLYAQRIDADGSVHSGWTADGVAICTAAGYQGSLEITSDGAGGAIFAWNDPRDAIPHEIPRRYRVYANRVDASGNTPVATLLRNFSAAWIDGCIKITWTLSEMEDDVEFSILRTDASRGSCVGMPSELIHREGLSYTFIDRDCEPAASCRYRVEYRDGDKWRILFETDPVTAPAMGLMLLQNHPNPFNPSTVIRYYLPDGCRIALDVHGVGGTLIARLDEGYRVRGSHTVVWNGFDNNGRRMSSGVYFCRLKAGKMEISKKMVLMR